MDFQTLNRRELQALCKLNKIPANITNIAMVDALKSLQTVEGIEQFLNRSRTETVELSIESPERIEVTSPRVPHTFSKTSPRKKAKIDAHEIMETPLLSCTKKNDPETSSFECEDIPTYSHMKVSKSSRKETVKNDTTVQTAYSTRRSTRLTAMKSQVPGVTIQEDLSKSIQVKDDVIVLDESDENSKIKKVVHVDTTFEKVDCCEEVDNLKVKLVEVFEQLEEKSGHVDNLSELSKLDNDNVVEVMNGEGIMENISENTVDFVNPNKQKVSMNFEDQVEEPQESLIEVEVGFLNPSISETADLSTESPERIEVTSSRVLCSSSRTCARKKAKINVNEALKTPLVSCTKKKDPETSLEERDEFVVNEVDNSEEKSGQVDNQKINSQVEFVNPNNQETSMEEKEITVVFDVNSEQVNQEGDVVEEENKFSTNGNDDVIDHPTTIEENENKNEKEDVRDEKTNKSLFGKNSLRQLKKRLKATLLNSPTSIRIKTEVSDVNSDIKESQVLVVEENEKTKSLNNTCSLRQLKKQLKAISVKYNMDTNNVL